jgi:peptidoglycan-N-acetylglucosamine deacetylase
VIAVNLILFFVFLYVVFPWIFGSIQRKVQKRKAVSKNTVFLTFDDGPGNRLTLQILAILKENGIRATFFLLGRNIPGREHIVQSIIKDGHAIASHGYHHLHAWKVLPCNLIWDIREGRKTILSIIGSETEQVKYAYRPPYGKMNILTLLYLWLSKIPIILWTIDSRDTWPESQRNKDYAAKKIGEARGGIVLFHDFDRATNDVDGYVLDSLEAVIKAGKKEGLYFSTIDELCEQMA